MLMLVFTGCPNGTGEDGDAYVAIDYNFSMPYSYEDNNDRTDDPVEYGHFYKCEPGEYEFEYYVDRNQFWYGTYEVIVNEGGGGDLISGGQDGADTYLILWCDPAGPEEERYEIDSVSPSDHDRDMVAFTQYAGDYIFRVRAWKGK